MDAVASVQSLPPFPRGWTATTRRRYPPGGSPCPGRSSRSSPAPSARACYHLVATGDKATGTGGHLQTLTWHLGKVGKV